ncbi:MAG: hypothetical protein K6G07_04355 [Lachnospiraceae bacterium]|nr:hypothetical protein [Lachnospiraceae bacterium]
MSSLLELRELIRNVYSKTELYLTPFLKFLLSLFCLLTINAQIGYMDRLNNIMVVLVISLLCSFLPTNCIVIFSALFIIAHMYAVSLECAVFGLGLFLVMFLLYFRFASKDAVILLLVPFFFAMKIPYVLAIAAGLLFSPLSFISVACGTVVYYLLGFISSNYSAIQAFEDESAVARFRYIIDNIIGNKEMLVYIAALSVMVIVVYLLRRMSVEYAWSIAIVAGAFVGAVVILMGQMMYETEISIVGMILGLLVAVLVGIVIMFFKFNVDYSRTEFVQFEDDEYYYYVKAVPKNSVSKPERKVKKITSVV